MKKMILMSSLFSVVSAMATDTRPFNKKDPAYTPNMARLEKKFQSYVKARDEYSKKQLKQATSTLLSGTTEGKTYDHMNEAWNYCINKRRYDDSICEGIYDLKKLALESLMETSQYQEKYLLVLNQHDHNDLMVAVLGRAREFAAYQTYRYASEKAAMLAGVDSYSNSYTSSDCVLECSNDYPSIIKQVKQDACELIEQQIK